MALLVHGADRDPGRRRVARRRTPSATASSSGSQPGQLTDRGDREFAEPLREPDRARATVQLYRTFLTARVRRARARRYNKKRLTVPTLLVFGENDFAIPKRMVSGDFSRYADHFEVEFVPDAGHFIVDEQPELVTRQIRGFFSAVDRPAAVG